MNVSKKTVVIVLILAALAVVPAPNAKFTTLVLPHHYRVPVYDPLLDGLLLWAVQGIISYGWDHRAEVVGGPSGTYQKTAAQPPFRGGGGVTR